jgi:hypothetical protein
VSAPGVLETKNKKTLGKLDNMAKLKMPDVRKFPILLLGHWTFTNMKKHPNKKSLGELSGWRVGELRDESQRFATASRLAAQNSRLNGISTRKIKKSLGQLSSCPLGQLQKNSCSCRSERVTRYS